jgi:hypothetical protein
MTWEIVAAVGSLGSCGGVVVLIFRAGRLVQRVDDLEERMQNIDKYGCRAASRIHGEASD